MFGISCARISRKTRWRCVCSCIVFISFLKKHDGELQVPFQKVIREQYFANASRTFGQFVFGAIDAAIENPVEGLNPRHATIPKNDVFPLLDRDHVKGGGRDKHTNIPATGRTDRRRDTKKERKREGERARKSERERGEEGEEERARKAKEGERGGGGGEKTQQEMRGREVEREILKRRYEVQLTDQ